MTSRLFRTRHSSGRPSQHQRRSDYLSITSTFIYPSPIPTTNVTKTDGATLSGIISVLTAVSSNKNERKGQGAREVFGQSKKRTWSVLQMVATFGDLATPFRENARERHQKIVVWAQTGRQQSQRNERCKPLLMLARLQSLERRPRLDLHIRSIPCCIIYLRVRMMRLLLCARHRP